MHKITRNLIVVWAIQCFLCFLLNMYLIFYFFRMLMYYVEQLSPIDADSNPQVSVKHKLTVFFLITMLFFT